MHGSAPDLRRLLERPGSYSTIAAAVAAGRLPMRAVRLFDHVGDVYGRVETGAGEDFAAVAAMRLAALVHEQPPASLPSLLAGAGLADLAPTVVPVIAGFGRIWKAASDAALRGYVGDAGAHLAALLLFELSHEGRPTAAMERAAAIGGLHGALAVWSGRLARAAASVPAIGRSETTTPVMEGARR